MRILFAIVLLCISGLSLNACNTVEGVGRDLESAGKKVQDL